MKLHALLLATALLAPMVAPALADHLGDTIVTPVLRADVKVTDDVVRVGDLVDHAGVAALVPVYRAPDLGTTGTLPAAQVLRALRQHDVIGVMTGGIKQVTVTRLARTITAKQIKRAVAQALAHRGSLGDGANLSLTFDCDLKDLQLPASNTGAMNVASVNVERGSGRFDVTFAIANEAAARPTLLRFTGTATEMVQAAVLTRDVGRAEILKSADIVIKRLPKAEVGNDPALRNQALGMQMRHPMRAGQPLHVADLAKADLVHRNQSVTLIYRTSGLCLTTRGKALDNGAEGDTVAVLNTESKRTVTGTVTARGEVSIQAVRPVSIAEASAVPSSEADAPVAIADGNGNSQATPKVE
jgi:flagella basal body P-ring formation protein FlgA